MDLRKTAGCINILGRFCGMKDIPLLTRNCLQSRYGIEQADVLILFGGSILNGGDVAAAAMKACVAARFMISGGVGHTTERLRQNIRAVYPDIETDGKPEADVFSAYIREKYGIEADLLERKSTNCGNNVQFALDSIRQYVPDAKNLIVIQDASMQRRMDAGFRKYTGSGIRNINYASYSATVTVKNDSLVYEEEIPGMWDMDRYLSLLMGEIPRLTDDSTGYGPSGKDFIAHVEVPDTVRNAFSYLQEQYADFVRQANPEYAEPSDRKLSARDKRKKNE